MLKNAVSDPYAPKTYAEVILFWESLYLQNVPKKYFNLAILFYKTKQTIWNALQSFKV